MSLWVADSIKQIYLAKILMIKELYEGIKNRHKDDSDRVVANLLFSTTNLSSDNLMELQFYFHTSNNSDSSIL